MIAQWEKGNAHLHYLQVSGGISAELEWDGEEQCWEIKICRIPTPRAYWRHELEDAKEEAARILREHLVFALDKLQP